MTLLVLEQAIYGAESFVKGMSQKTQLIIFLFSIAYESIEKLMLINVSINVHDLSLFTK